MTDRISSSFLRSLRNDIPIEKLIVEGLKIPNKRSEGFLRFLCPVCGQFNTATKKEINLARCFRCQKNFNPIDMVMAELGKKFMEAVKFLKPFWIQFYKEKSKKIIEKRKMDA
jgi:DNA primase